ncbi:hypothetical protein GCM10023220_33030 [Streptomyces ziwulingensis]|uniref:Uncharacterized protein n=1 Tax=Streptomyces ziwulingensis TaxID=1045501 RepID=A0ABP9BWU6_9ACTN
MSAQPDVAVTHAACVAVRLGSVSVLRHLAAVRTPGTGSGSGSSLKGWFTAFSCAVCVVVAMVTLPLGLSHPLLCDASEKRYSGPHTTAERPQSCRTMAALATLTRADAFPRGGRPR